MAVDQYPFPDGRRRQVDTTTTMATMATPMATNSERPKADMQIPFCADCIMMVRDGLPVIAR